MNNLNTHCSESMVRMIAEQIGFTEDLGKKGLRGILKSTETRRAFVTNPDHRITCVFTPRHCSWLNRIEMWFGTLERKLLRGGSFCSLKHLEERILSFFDYHNENLARPYSRTYTGKALAVLGQWDSSCPQPRPIRSATTSEIVDHDIDIQSRTTEVAAKWVCS